MLLEYIGEMVLNPITHTTHLSNSVSLQAVGYKQCIRNMHCALV